jgi:MATE family multidrug resistance protein
MFTFTSELQKSLQLSIPLIIVLLVQLGVELVSTIMLAKLGPVPLAAGALGMSSLVFLLVVFIGFQNATGVLIARFSHSQSDIKNILNQGIYLAIFLGILAMVVVWYIPDSLRWLGEDGTIVALTKQFMHALMLGIPALPLFLVLREFVTAMLYTKFILLISFCNIPLAILVNYILLYGKWGVPAFGISGLGYALSLVHWFSLISLVIYILFHKILRNYLLFNYFPVFCWSHTKEILKLGWPISINLAFEWGMFSIITLMMGHFGVLTLAAHQIALQCAGLAYMLPLGVAQAAGILVSKAIGTSSLEQAKRMAYLQLAIGIVLALISGIIFFTMPVIIIRCFMGTLNQNNIEIIPIASSFLRVMAIFQFLDAIQVIMCGVLRGLKDTLMPMMIGLLAYWFVGLTVGYIFSFKLHLGGIGLWWGLGIGISVSGILLFGRFFKLTRSQLIFAHI